MLHQVLGVVNAYWDKTVLLIHAKHDGPALVLVGKAGQGVIKTSGTALRGGFQFQRLGFCPESLHLLQQVF